MIDSVTPHRDRGLKCERYQIFATINFKIKIYVID